MRFDYWIISLPANTFYMRVVFLLIAVFFALNLQAQLPTKNGVVFYEQVDTLPGLSKDEVYKRSKQWIVHAFKDAQEVMQLDSREDGEIIGKGSLDCTYRYVGVPIPCFSRFTIKLTARDGKHRIQIYDFSGTRPERIVSHVDFDDLIKKPNKAENKRMVKQINEQVNYMFETLRLTLLQNRKDDF